jgi:REP element-mobilizing transposase RayT
MFLELLRKYQEQYGIKIFAFCLLPDHLHLLVELQKQIKDSPVETGKSQEISDFMHDLNNNYTKYFNGRYERKGHLFRERFKAALVEKDKFLLEMTAYIHLNPEKLNLTNDAKSYPYSTYQLYLLDEQAKQEDLKFLNAAVKEALDLLQNRSYPEFVQGVSEEQRALISKKLNRGGILGSEEFIKRVREEVEVYQAQGLAKKYEMIDKKGYKLFLVFGSLFLILLVGAGLTYVFFVRREQAKMRTQIQAAESKKGKNTDQLEEIKLSEWDIKLDPITGGNVTADKLSFMDGKFLSANMNSLGFSSSNYSVSIDHRGKIIWETMQTASSGTASWRGEIENDKMTGILSLRENGKTPQDFSFVSIGQGRKIQ